MRTRRVLVSVAALVWLFGAAAPAARAGALFSTFNYDAGLGKELYNENAGYGIGYESGLSRGALFVPNATARLTSVEVAVSWNEGTRSFQAGIWKADGTNGLPGTLVELLPVSNTMLNWSQWETPILINSSLHPILSGSEAYWLILSAVASDTKAAWNLSGYPSYYGVGYTHTTNPEFSGTSQFTTLGAMRVNGHVVPEPTAWVSMSLGVAALAFLANRRRLV